MFNTTVRLVRRLDVSSKQLISRTIKTDPDLNCIAGNESSPTEVAESIAEALLTESVTDALPKDPAKLTGESAGSGAPGGNQASALFPCLVYYPGANNYSLVWVPVDSASAAGLPTSATNWPTTSQVGSVTPTAPPLSPATAAQSYLQLLQQQMQQLQQQTGQQATTATTGSPLGGAPITDAQSSALIAATTAATPILSSPLSTAQEKLKQTGEGS